MLYSWLTLIILLLTHFLRKQQLHTNNMICIISPAKSLSEESTIKETVPSTNPRFLSEADEIAGKLQKNHSAVDYRKCMKVSAEIAFRTNAQYQSYIFNSSGCGGGGGGRGKSSSVSSPSSFSSSLRQAGLLFDGPAYRGLDCKSLTYPEMIKCTKHVRFLIGIY